MKVWKSLQCVALFALIATSGCTPLAVVTHSVSANESSVPPGMYQLDAHHWNVSFDVDHLHYSRFVMRFDKTAGQLDWSADGMTGSTVHVTIDAASVNTNVPLLDRMVKGPDMFDVARYPNIEFVSTGFTRTGNDKGTLAGNLTIRGTTRPVTLDVTFNGHSVDPLTKLETLGFSADGHFSRAQFGLTTWYPAVGDDVHVAIQAEFAKVKQ
ncbi:MULTISPECIES: YceI family protein [unclassified Caballeronia]|uniref:YceI family protein n=1 Tax=unclassified Caballeronia TaxID=2646786 RepID=UPI00285E8D1B|nr:MULTISPECIES: YceI family protein [unclassified Caballeronia]MDR5776178.1 YceI family protein [Caballeronia sp. LZ002]MDR5851618.1 YceI family protein [Caballeronia sp. LZ003]